MKIIELNNITLSPGKGKTSPLSSPSNRSHCTLFFIHVLISPVLLLKGSLRVLKASDLPLDIDPHARIVKSPLSGNRFRCLGRPLSFQGINSRAWDVHPPPQRISPRSRVVHPPQLMAPRYQSSLFLLS
ncbi:hypothetical protein HNY73_013050 [Argiope bruennichi]|uniref:Uncharacterized protein n=1 Tax=Argiope bruennichi TaxID=94029 RepID=A0A8T0F2Q4_ARGBR|nr:hypothetical protein HNY73_013050 [Argiope bruennichi]